MEKFKPQIDKPLIGKNVIETLTLGMYENALFIYREYVQNAADQIDVALEDIEERILDKKSDGHINISIDKEKRLIIIADNATGIKSNEVLKFLGDVANSEKDRTKRKGFRGIGRLGGLGYCETLIFETSYKGEATKSIISLNAKQLKEIIEDTKIKMDAATVISVITSHEKFPEDIDKHYFKVKLNNVTNDELLDVDEVTKYLSIVAPIPFNNQFPFVDKIHSYFNDNNVKIDEYNVQLSLNSIPLYKPYRSKIHSKTGYKPVEIIDIDFFKIYDAENNIIALGWYGITDLLNNIIHQDYFERGLRIRKGNIQIGSEDTLNVYFREDRFNHHFIGEIYVIGDMFVPNARRDFFNDNKTVQRFKDELKKEFKILYDLSHISSNLHNGINIIKKFKSDNSNFKNKVFNSEFEEKQEISKLENLKREAQEGQIKITHALKKATKAKYNSILDATLTIYKYKKGVADLSIDDELIFDTKKYEKPSLSKLDESHKKIVFEIFKIIEVNISNDVDTVVKLKKKITEYYN